MPLYMIRLYTSLISFQTLYSAFRLLWFNVFSDVNDAQATVMYATVPWFSFIADIAMYSELIIIEDADWSSSYSNQPRLLSF